MKSLGLRFLGIAIFSALLFGWSARLCLAQGIGVEPTKPEVTPSPRFGIEFGIGQDEQHGSFLCPCGDEFSGGTGRGFSGSAFFELPIGLDFFAGLSAGFDQKHTTTSRPENEIVIVESGSGNLDTAILPINRTGTVTLSLVRFEPFIQYQILRSNFFVQVGAGVSVVTSSNLLQTRAMTSSSITLPDGSQINNLTFANGNRSENIQDGAIDGINTLEFSALLSAGYTFVFAKSFLAPMVTYDYPFSNIGSQNSSDWKISSLYASLALGFVLD